MFMFTVWEFPIRRRLLLGHNWKLGHDWLATVFGLFTLPDATQLNSTSSEHVQNSATGKKLAIFSRVELSRVVRAFTLRRAVWTLLRPDSTQLNCQLSWVELSRVGQCERGLTLCSKTDCSSLPRDKRGK